MPDNITQIYRDVFGRDPDAGGLATYADALATGFSLAQVRGAIANSPEALTVAQLELSPNVGDGLRDQAAAVWD